MNNQKLCRYKKSPFITVLHVVCKISAYLKEKTKNIYFEFSSKIKKKDEKNFFLNKMFFIARNWQRINIK